MQILDLTGITTGVGVLALEEDGVMARARAGRLMGSVAAGGLVLGPEVGPVLALAMVLVVVEALVVALVVELVVLVATVVIVRHRFQGRDIIMGKHVR